MTNRSFLRTILACVLTFSMLGVSLPAAAPAQTAAKSAKAPTDIEKRLSLIEEKIEKRRRELGIPGVAVAIVKDDKVLMSKGFGYKDFEKKVPMTADTQLPIGSATKAFTALSVLMLHDAGKLSLDDPPKKHLPYFRIDHPETDKNIQVRDLLAHTSGLNRTDLAMITGKLDREELIKVAGRAKPMAGLREKFFYQNIMYAAAGEVVAQVSGMPWEKFVPEKIFTQLGMDNSTMSVREMQKAKDFSYGYTYNFDTKQTRRLPTREIAAVAPAGSINSSASDMARWIRFVLDEGEFGGRRLISAESFKEWTKPHMKISPDGKVSYGLGWFLQEWKGRRVVQHGGNIDGFNSMVAMIPEEDLGFVMLTNVSASSLGNELMQIVWSGILEDINRGPVSEETLKEIGKYRFAQAGFDIEVRIEDNRLVAVVPGQPTYILEKVEGRKYKLSNAPAGFFITFRDKEAFLEQPQGNFTLPKESAPETEQKTGKSADDPARELIGRYESEASAGTVIEIKEADGKVALVVEPQPPYPLVRKTGDEFRSPNLPDAYAVKVRRGEDGKIEGITLVQPNGEFAFRYIGETEKNAAPEIGAEELVAKTIEALGGSDNLRKLNSRVMKFDMDLVNQGLKAKGVTYQQAPNRRSSRITIDAFGRRIAEIRDFFDGKSGGEQYSFGPDEEFTGQRLEDIRLASLFHGLLDWKEKIGKIEVVKKDKIGDEEVYVLSLEPEKANKFTIYISAETFLPVRRTSVIVSSTSPQKIPVVENMSDYRKVDGVMLPFRIVTTNPAMGEIVIEVREIEHNVGISDEKFAK